MNKTAVEWLIDEYFGGIESCTPEFRVKINEAIMKEVDNAMTYARVIVSADRMDLPLIKYIDFLKL